MKPAVHYASKNTVFVEMLYREKYFVSIILNPIYSTYNFKKCVQEEHLRPETR
jgi:hypothetical protein